MRLFRRAWRVQIDTLDVSNLDIEFKILATLKPEPNKGVVTVWNLNQDHRAQILKRNRPNGNQTHGIPVQVEAGYVDNTAVLLSADLREAVSQRDGTDWKTVLSGDDAGRAYRESRISAQWPKGTPIGTVLTQCAQALGVGSGNVNNFTADAEISGIGAKLAHSFTADGNVSRELDRLLKSIGLTWSVQHGALQVLRRGAPLNQSAIRISSSTGLLGSPEAAIDATVSLGNPQQFAAGAKLKVAKPPKPKDPGILKIKTLLIPGMAPGRKIVLESEQFNGGYMLTEVEYVGQSWTSGEWRCDCVARVY